MKSFSSEADYLHALEERSTLPAGFLSATTAIRFFPPERETKEPLSMNISLVLLEKATPLFAAAFTRNKFPGAPVLIGKERLKRRTTRGVLVNNKISNVCTPGGREHAERLLSRLGELAGCTGADFFPASTGIIGWRLPLREMEDALPALVKGASPGSILPVARSIMTTDSFPKVRRAAVGEGSIVGIAKGAGMIEPNMATMLCFLFTDVEPDRGFLRRELSFCVESTLNRISVDGDQSTSDTAILFSSGARGKADRSEFERALLEVLSGLADDIVRNGEGAGHVIRVRVKGLRDERISVGIGKAIVNSPLVKTAIFGNDPNVGRIVSALGDFLGNGNIFLDPSKAAVHMGGIEIFSNQAFRLDSRKETELSAYLTRTGFDPKVKGFPPHDESVVIEVILGDETPWTEVLGTDLSYEYVRENADYRT